MDKMMTDTVKYKIHPMIFRALPPVCALALAVCPTGARTGGVPAPSGKPFPGEILLAVDATDTARRIVRVRQSIPAKAGPLTLLYPRYIPGMHAPNGPIDRLAGLSIQAGGKPLGWVRDTAEMHAFHLTVPRGVGRIEVAFDYLSPVGPPDGAPTLTRDLTTLAWHPLILYPAGHGTAQIRVTPSLKLPQGFTPFTSLQMDAQGDGMVRFRTVSAEELIDSPVFAGRHTAQHSLGLLGGLPRTAGSLPGRRARDGGRFRPSALRPLPHAAGALGPGEPHEPGAFPFERECVFGRQLQPLGRNGPPALPGRARADPPLERQVPAAPRPRHP
jgi:hypothetical protein